MNRIPAKALPIFYKSNLQTSNHCWSIHYLPDMHTSREVQKLSINSIAICISAFNHKIVFVKIQLHISKQ